MSIKDNQLLRRVAREVVYRVPALRARRKYASELEFWKGELAAITDWYEGRSKWLGVPTPAPEEKYQGYSHPVTNAVMTFFTARPYYMNHLEVRPDHFVGKRVLEVGCGPMAPILQFVDCERHGIDPLMDLYIESGWPMYEYDAKFVCARAESMPYPDDYFDAVISVNALDHVDDFLQVAAEIERVLKPNGELRFEVEYHEPTTTEPIALDDRTIRFGFSNTQLTKIAQRGAQQVYADSGIVTTHPDETMAVWSGVRRAGQRSPIAPQDRL